MSIFKAEVRGKNIILTNNNSVISQIPINSLYLNNGNRVNDVNEFIKDQEKINYMDSIKDGANVVTMQNLNIYPKAENGGYPVFPNDLKLFEKNILKARNNYLEHTNWLKVKKGTLLNKGKNYGKCLWESGLGYNVFLDNPDKVITVKTFGSYIDPLEKQNADEVWPPKGSTITLTKQFMKLFGFGEHSLLNAKTISNTSFEYIMNIGCGNECETSQNQCTITHIGDNNNPKTPSNVYFSGNNQKKQFLKSNVNTKPKVKFIVIKEWGDKIQVLIYLIYYYFLKERETLIMTTCDMVVFMLCLNLSIPCVYTGVYNPPGLKLALGKKYYSILEFKPSNIPFTDTYKRLQDKIISITNENDTFIKAVEKLTTDEGANTIITNSSNMLIFSKEFYTQILDDLNAIQQTLRIKGQELINKYRGLSETSGKLKIQQIESEIKYIQSNYIIVPFLKKKTAQSILTILMTKSYTANKPIDNSKPAIKQFLLTRGMNENLAEKESKKSFYEIAVSPKNGFLKSRDGSQIGGSLTEIDIELFPEDDNSDSYIYYTNGEIENDSISYNDYPLPKSPIFNPVISVEKEEKNLLSMLKKSFTETFDIFNPQNTMYKLDNFRETIYTLFVYESYINGCGNVVFDNTDLTRIINDYKLMVDEENIPIGENVRATTPKKFKQGLDTEKLREQKMKGRSKFQKTMRASQLNKVRDMNPLMSPNYQQSLAIASYGGLNHKRRFIKRKTLRKRKNKNTTRKK
jgi:hypothetical protein